MTKKDLVIVGAGPAGLSASIYAARSLVDAVTLERESVGGQAILTSAIDNYPGVPHTVGFDLAESMRAQAVELGAHIQSAAVEHIGYDPKAKRFELVTDAERYEAKAVVYAAGARPRRAGFEGEERFAGHGVSYCATCDGMFYRNKPVFVIGGGNSAAEEALFLSHIASKVTLVVRKGSMRAQAALMSELMANPKVEVLFNTIVEKLVGEKRPETMTLKNVMNGSTSVVEAEERPFGVFVLAGRQPNVAAVAELVDMDENGYIVCNERLETSTPGLFVAGDVRATPLRQVITAAADGAVAATSAVVYLEKPDLG